MSPPKLKTLLTGLLVAAFVAVGGSVIAQDTFRLWKPLGPESFSGRRSNDGVYSSLSGIYWSIGTPKGGYIGATSAKGDEETRWVYDGRKVFAQTNSIKINMMDPIQTWGTRFEVGNRRGHNGWLVSGYGLPSQKHSMSVQNATITIRDEGDITFQTHVLPYFNGLAGGHNLAPIVFVWDRAHNSLYDPTATPNSQYYPFADWQVTDGKSLDTISGVGYLWGYYHFSHANPDGDGFIPVSGVFAPLPIWFKDVDVTVDTSHYSAELVYTYRTHPFTWGSMELLAGARYWDFKDRFGFDGRGPGDPTVDDTNSNNNVDPVRGPTSVLADMTVNALAKNHVFGPQVGMKLSRQNARWTFGAEGRVTGGINAQSLKTQGYIATNFDYNSNYNNSLGTLGDDGLYFPAGLAEAGHSPYTMWTPVGLQYNNTNFGHKKNKTVFSPIGEIRFSADWQWTEAVSFFGAVDGMAAGNIARGARVTNYVVQSDGTIFGIRGNDRNTTVTVCGAEVGIKVRR